jgi:hypothetical protein
MKDCRVAQVMCGDDDNQLIPVVDNLEKLVKPKKARLSERANAT